MGCQKSTKVTRTTPSFLEKRKVEDKVVHEDAQEAAAAADPISQWQRKIASTLRCTNTDDAAIFESSINDCIPSQSPRSGHKESSTIWSDEVAPQSLIEEALNRRRKFDNNILLPKTNENGVHREDEIASKHNFESIISDLEKKLSATRVELTDALNEQLFIKNKYKKALRNVKIAADEDRNDMKLLKMCTSVLEKYGPCAHANRRVKRHHKKYPKPLQHFGKISANLYRKLKNAARTSTKLKEEVLSTKKDLDDKTQEYKSLAKCFENLKLELKSAEININDLKNESISLRKKLESMQMKVSKDRHEKINAAQFREIQRSREMSNLKKKSEEDLSTIAQLRNKLLRVESANSNKGFLLCNYKSQLADLSKEKEKLSIKIKELENDNSLLRSNNAQLKASVTIINNEKEKITTETEKSETEMMERIQSKLTTKYERSMLQKIDTMKSKYDKVIESMETKLRYSENLVTQYFAAIKLFLKKVHDYYRELDTERDLSCSEASEREAHETACSILNITPSELSGFLKGRPPKTINSWLSELQKITSNKIFAEELGKLLFARAIDSAKN